MNEIVTRIIRDGDRRVIEIPKEFATADTEVTIRQDGGALIVEPVTPSKAKPKTWAEILDQMETIDVDWPDVDEGLLPTDDVNL
ncbi:hypothetical protein O9Z70_03110 [Devosia sp. YIM 151766]|uniref:antitoxin n=1 Tax=Devosia sp. YIM 151766 TaxID=3017325 RepID=UPI00255C3759|nr:hypothetical protein [Devosia sp. YIM 151766]WIY53545.1 hypothetical protein O9Z70_03110 [Devosia sp. YIM 151766]